MASPFGRQMICASSNDRSGTSFRRCLRPDRLADGAEAGYVFPTNESHLNLPIADKLMPFRCDPWVALVD